MGGKTQLHSVFCKDLASIFIDYHKKIFGKGPGKVKIMGDNGQYSITISGFLNKYEEYLVNNLIDGEEEIIRLRKKVFDSIKEQFICTLKDQLKVEVLGLTLDINKDFQIIYGVIIIKEEE